MLGSRIMIFMGMFGSGKTEISLNVAELLAKNGAEIALADIDVISPYFRSRDLADEFASRGVKIITPPGHLKHADLPIISPSVHGYITNKSCRLVLDVGGNDDGAIVLGSLNHLLKHENVSTYFVVNPYRPFTDTVEKVVDHIRRLSSESRMKVDFLINNSNLGTETTRENVLYGEEFIEKVSELTGIKVEMTVTMDGLVSYESRYPMLKIKKYMKTPWEV